MTNRVAKLEFHFGPVVGATGAVASINSLQQLTKLERFEIQALVSL